MPEESNPIARKWSSRRFYTLFFVVYDQKEPCSSPKIASACNKDISDEQNNEDVSSGVLNSWLLLGLKQRGFGSGRWNGFGGKVQTDDATVLSAALRELQEECGLDIMEDNVEEAGRLWFTFEDQSECMEVHVFICRRWTPLLNGHVQWPCNTEEMHPQWFPIGSPSNGIDLSRIPFRNMWPDDQFWLPHLLSGRHVLGWFHFKPISTHIISEPSTPRDCSNSTAGLEIAPYEVPAYRLQLFSPHANQLKHGTDNSYSFAQNVIASFRLDEQSTLKEWMSSREPTEDANSEVIVFG